MRRSVLLTLALVGALVSVVGGVGLFAALNDTATTGTITAQSGALAGAADIKLTTATLEDTDGDGLMDVACDTTAYSDDLATDGQIVSVNPGFSSDKLYFCVKNVGSQPVGLTLDAFEMVDVELDCTGDESLADSTSCGLVSGAPGVGELSGVLRVTVEWYLECNPGFPSAQSSVLKTLTTVGGALTLHGVSAGGTPECFSLMLSYPDPAAGESGNTQEMVQAAQSDEVSWRFRFNAAA